MIAGTANGANLVALTAKSLIVANWATICDAAWLKAMGAPNLPAPVAANIYTSQRAFFSAETQPAFGITVVRTDARITDGLGAMDQVHELEIAVTADWGYYDGVYGVEPLIKADPPDPVIPFDILAYEVALRTYIEGVVVLLCSSGPGLINYDAMNGGSTGIYNCLPAQGITAQDFVVGEDDTGATLTQQTVRATIQVYQRRTLAR